MNTPIRILRRRDVSAKVGLGMSAIYAGIAAGAFPAPIKLGERASGWIEAEIDAWIASRPRLISIAGAPRTGEVV